MTQEEKAKAYDKALKRAKDMLSYKEVRHEDMEYLFPELKESEDENADEKVRKALIKLVTNHASMDLFIEYDIHLDEALSWLEKPCENNKWKPSKEEMDALYGLAYITNKMDDKKDEAITKLYQDLKREFFSKVSYENMFPSSPVNAPIKLEKQGEQKSADKVELKFKNGQWIVWQDKCYKVNCNSCGYELVDQNGLSTSLEYGTVDENAHLWEITKDAKDGDVLSDGTTIFIFKDLLSDDSVMSYCDYDTNRCESDAFCPLSMNLMCLKITPATKEQRDLLFQKMKEAGYEWDAEKKELKKIENKIEVTFGAKDSELQEATYYIPKGFAEIEGNNVVIKKGEQKPTWSEEDEDYINDLIKYFSQNEKLENTKEDIVIWLKSLKERVQPQTKQEWSKDDEQYLLVCKNALAKYQTTDKWDANIISHWLEDKLKSVRPQNTWKPTKQQLLELRCAISGCSFETSILVELEENLKKLL